MSENINLKQLEQKAWRSIFQDGLYDIFLGYLILHMGIVYTLAKTDTAQAAITSINMGIYFLAALLLYLGKRFITYPRAGRVKFGAKRRGKLAWLAVVYFVVLLAALVLTLLALDNGVNFLSEKVKAVLSVSWLSIFLLLFFGVPAFLLKYNRLYLIAVMFALPEPLLKLFKALWGIDLGIFAYAVPALVVLVMGISVLVRFIRTYPVVKAPAGEDEHA